MASAAQLAKISPPKKQLFNSSGKRTWMLSLLLVLLTLVTYNPVTHNDFVSYDDTSYITSNQHIRSGLNWSTVEWAFLSTEVGNWHPLTWISHALDYQLFHLNPVGHHYISVLLHGLTAVFLFLFLQAATGFAWRSLMVAALFAIHPLNVESVAWASERKNVLCMFFFALLLLAYRWYAQHPGWKRYALVAVPFAMGLMSKPMLVTAPFLLLLLDYWPLGRTKEPSASTSDVVVSPLSATPGREVAPSESTVETGEIQQSTRPRPLGWLIAEKLPLLAMSVASCVVTIIAQKADGAIHSGDFTFWNRLQNAIVSYARYLTKTIWPADLAAFYPHPQHLPGWQVALAALLLFSITIVVLLFCKKQPYLGTGWLWFLGAMVPVIGLVQVGEQGMADRYAYLPLIGIFVAIIWAIGDWAQERRIPTLWLAALAVCALGALLAITRKEISYWKDTRTLWAHTLSITDHNYVAEASLGAELISQGEIQEASKHLQAGIAINPRDPFSRLNLGVCEKRLGHVDEAVRDYKVALTLASDPSLRRAAYRNLGSIYRTQRDYALASENFEAALQILPDDLVALTGLGLIAHSTGNTAQAVDYFARAAKSQPSDAQYLLLAQALAEAGRQQESQATLARAQTLSQNWDATVQGVDRLLHE